MIEVRDYIEKDFSGLLERYVYVFSKLKGTFVSVCLDQNEILHIYDKKREIKPTDNSIRERIYVLTLNSTALLKFLKENRNYIIHGVWLNYFLYRSGIEGKFYIVDVVDKKKEYDRNIQENINLFSYLPYFQYSVLLEKYYLNYLPCLYFKRFNLEELKTIANQGSSLIKYNGVGPGIVIKNYYYYNLEGKQMWAQIKSNIYQERREL